MEHLCLAGTKVYIVGPSHITKMASLPIYGKNPLEVFSINISQMSLKLGTQQKGLEPYKVYINDDSRLTSPILQQCQLCSFRLLHWKILTFDQYLTALQRQSRTSHQMAYRQIATSTDYIKYSFFPHTIVHWNSLPPEVVSLPNVDDFNRPDKPRLTLI